MVDVVGNLFPLKPFVQSMQAAFNPAVDAPAFEWGKLAVVAAWGVAGRGAGVRGPSSGNRSPTSGRAAAVRRHRPAVDET